ncbi:TetR/AcrR family transcriptional regulator [Mycolicibacterium sp.]|nr:TetR/AcrR family transcriptional regulator [Mycolicibacterium chitae]
MARMTSLRPSTDPSAQRDVRAELLHAAVGLLDDHGPDALQTRKVAGAAGTSTMAVYTHFGGMRALIAAVADEGLRQFDAALTVPLTEDPVADLLRCGAAYRRFAIGRPHLYRLMFGSTSAHGIHAPAHNVLTLRVAEITAHHPSLAHVVRHVHRAMVAGRISAGSPDDDASVLTIAAQFWTMMHGFVMLELAGYYGEVAFGPVLGALAGNTLLSLGDTAEALAASQTAATQDL